MRRSTKTALGSAFVIAVVAAQIRPADVGWAERSYLTQHKASLVQAMEAKFNINGNPRYDPYYQMLAQVERLRSTSWFGASH